MKNATKKNVGSGKSRGNTKYFSCWEYRENGNDDFKIILYETSKKKMFRFPYENMFCYKDKNNKLNPLNESIVIDMFGRYPHEREIAAIKGYSFNQNYVGFSFLAGGKIIAEIPSYWVGKKVKLLTKDLSSFPKSNKPCLTGLISREGIFSADRIRRLFFDLEKYCIINET